MLTVTVVGLLLAAAVLVLAVPRFEIFGDRVAQYFADVSEENGVFHVSEQYVYRLSGTRHLIYRNWDANVSLSALNQPYVRLLFVSCPSGTIPYFVQVQRRDFFTVERQVRYYIDGRWVGEPQALSRFPNLPVEYVHEAEKPEVGCVSTTGVLPPGDYEMNVFFDVYPPVQCDGHYCHANVSLTGTEHFDYQHVSLHFDGADVQDYIQRPPSWFLTLFGLPGDRYLEIETLLRPISGYPFVVPTSNVPQRFDAARSEDILYYFLYLLAVLVVVLIPILVFAYWYFFARDRPDPSVPDYLMNVPNPERKPWMVNAVFDDQPGRFSRDAFAATVLDLKERGVLEISGKGREAQITVLNVPEDLDEYERAVIRFLRAHSPDGKTFAPEYLKAELHSASDAQFRALQRGWNYITGDSPLAMRVAKQFIHFPSGMIMATVGLLAFLFLLVWYMNGPEIAGWAGLALAVYSLLLVRLPPDVLGRWKNGYGREYAQWQAFKRFLSDLTLIRKYSEQFQSMWHDWLIYGTALGVADRVLEALREINIPDVDTYYSMYSTVRATTDSINTAYVVRAAEFAAANAMRAAGGFGAGGGFGGGGAGAR